jgi:hypothetical protein
MIRTWPASVLLSFLLAAPLVAQSPTWESVGRRADDALGTSVHAAGDVNADGVPDVIVGAPSIPGGASSPGYARVLSGADGSLIWRLTTTGEADLFGTAVAGVGDVDDDGFDDVIVGAPAGAPPPGESCARVFRGIDGTLMYELPAVSKDSWAAFGFSLDGIGDIDDDELDDWIVGAPSFSGETPGFARVYCGLDGVPMFEFDGLAIGDQFGYAVALAGDVDDDGVHDVVVGAGMGDYARVFSGADGTLIHHLPGLGLGSGFGRAVSAAGDVNGDGFDDVAVGAPGFDTVDVRSGENGSLLRRFVRQSGAFGNSVDVIPDLDGDGVPDYAIGAPEDTISGDAFAGSVFLISGSTGNQLFRFAGSSEGGRLGSSVATVGDVDDDGLFDVALGAPGLDDGPTLGAGHAAVMAGSFAGSIIPYGFGCPDSFLITPELEMLGDPTGNGPLDLIVTRGPGGSFALIFFGTGQGLQLLDTGCILWVEPLLPLNLSLTLAGMFPGSGTATVTGHLPPGLPVGSTFTMQAFVADPNVPGGYSTSNAVQLTTQ